MGRWAILVAVIAAAIACGTIRFEEHTIELINRNDYRKTVRIPEVGTSSTAEIGKSMISAYGVFMMPAIVLRQPLEHVTAYSERLRMSVKVPAGTLDLVGSDASGQFYASDSGVFQAYESSKGFDSPERLIGGIYVRNAGSSEVYWHWAKHSEANSSPAPGLTFDRTVHERAPTAQRFRKELVYSGVSGSTVSVRYREFADDMARPAFSQDLKYDTAQSNLIGYKGARFEVIKAENTSIRFKVLKQLD